MRIGRLALAFAVWISAAVGLAAVAQTNEGIVGFWELNECGGDLAFDASGYGNHATVAGAVWDAAQLGCALRFESVADSVTVPMAQSLEVGEPVSVSAWVFQLKKSGTTWGGIVTIGGHSPIQGWSLRMGWGTDWRFGVGDGSKFISPEAAGIALQKWTHLVGTYDGVTIRMYANGRLVRELPCQARIQLPAESGLVIGNARGAKGLAFPFPGLVDSIRVYSRALTPAEVVGIFEAGRL